MRVSSIINLADGTLWGRWCDRGLGASLIGARFVTICSRITIETDLRKQDAADVCNCRAALSFSPSSRKVWITELEPTSKQLRAVLKPPTSILASSLPFATVNFQHGIWSHRAGRDDPYDSDIRSLATKPS